MDADPVIWCLVSLPLNSDDPPEEWTSPFPVALETAAYLKDQGYAVLVDPAGEADMVRWRQIQRSCQRKKKWYETGN